MFSLLTTYPYISGGVLIVIIGLAVVAWRAARPGLLAVERDLHKTTADVKAGMVQPAVAAVVANPTVVTTVAAVNAVASANTKV